MHNGMAQAWDGRVLYGHRLLWPIARAARELAALADWPTVAELDAGLAPRAGVRFASALARSRRRPRGPAAAAYDASICLEGRVPTRAASWHDLFNALVWASMPRSKRALHERQHRAHEARSAAAPSRRTREGDGLALVDEGGAVLLCTDAARPSVEEALSAREREPVAVAIARGEALGVVFGHAVFEHLGTSQRTVRATVHVVSTPAIPRDADACVWLADAGLSRALADPKRFAAPEAMASIPVELAYFGVPRDPLSPPTD